MTTRHTKLASKVLEDKSTLFIMEKLDYDKVDIPWAPLAELVSIFALQPRKDIKNASQTLFHATNHPGIEVIREIFPAKLANSKRNKRDDSHTALLLLVRVSYKFRVKSERFLPAIVQEARKAFVKRRSMVHTILEASGCRVTLVTGEKLIQVHFHRERVPAGITVFKGYKGFQSKWIEPFLHLDRVPSRHIQHFAAPELPVVHKVGSQITNSAQPVGFPALCTGSVLVCGSTNTEVLTILQQLIASLAETDSTQQIFVIDTYSELNGLIQHFQVNPPPDLHLQMFRLGTNIHLNLCDVVIPISASGKKTTAKARAAWKSHLISQILLSSLHTSEYLTARYSVPLEAQIKKTAESMSLFTLQEVKLSIGGVNESGVQVNTEGIDMMFADMMAIEALAGILEQFRSFPEVNYAAFTGHYSNTLVRDKTVTFFQFGAQPPLIRRATIGFLLHYLSQTMKNGCVVLTHAAEFLSRRTAYGRQREIISSIVVDACKTIARDNIMMLGSQSLQALATNMDNFEEIKNSIYLKLASAQDRELLFTSHEIAFTHKSPIYTQQQFIGIAEGEGLLFREDSPQNSAYHFSIESLYPVDFDPIFIPESKQRGSETLGLTPVKYELLMKLLKLLIYQPRRVDEVMGLIEEDKQGVLALDQFQSLGLFTTGLEGGATYWTITERGREYYQTQLDFVNKLPAPLTHDKVHAVSQELQRLESYFDISSSQANREKMNTQVKNLVGSLVNYIRHLRATSIPWIRIAEYHDLHMIDSLEWQDFRHLFDLAHSMVNNLLLENSHLQQQASTEELHQVIQASAIPSRPDKKLLDDFLPDDNLVRLQQFARELGVAPYPKTGIFDLYYALHTNQRSLFEELKVNKKDK
ncbi:MAG: hypothetical protein JSU57_02255 [Candidatus Heimdallarchaeota archaeon]|nr:MAG: hypothetical protein JSU57_02255 [Candidatus Heimdallarchaeota archaeon]